MFKKFNEMNKWEKGGLIFGVTEMLVGVGMIIYGTVQERKILKELAAQNEYKSRIDEIIGESNEILDELLNETQTVSEESKNEFLEIMKRTEELMKEQGTK